MPVALPIDPILPELVEKLRSSPSLVLEAEPGAGKTTRVPWAMLEAGLSGKGDILVLEPRRLATRLAAKFVAEERGEKPGETVGYQVRFEDVSGPKTRLRYLTEGVLTRRLLTEPTLPKVGAVVLDEFHERHLQGDLGLALLRNLQKTKRPDLKLVVMSATLEAEPVASYLGGVPSMKVAGRRYEVTIEHQPLPEDRPLEAQVASAVRRLVDEGLDGDVLVFLPGAAEIRKAAAACEPIANRANLLVVPLHGDLPGPEQDRAVRPADRRKVILSTNVAESSVTIERVVAVVDSGLARIAGHSAWTGMATLKVGKVSKASAIQRAGRAGRLRPGRCLRLYTRHDFDTRPDHEAPEIRRLDLAEAALALHGAGIRDLAAFDWFEPPPAAALEAAESLLQRLGAVSGEGELTEIGRRMLRFPLHPRQTRVLLEAEARGRADDGCVLAALLGERDIRLDARGIDLHSYGPKKAKVSGPSDLLESLELVRQAERRGLSSDAVRSLALDMGATQAVERVRRNLSRQVDRSKKPSDPDPDRPLLIATLAGYPDRVARRRHLDRAGATTGQAELLMCGGGSASLSDTSVVRDSVLLVAVDAEERPGRPGSARGGALVRLASAVEPEWLLDLFADRLRDETEITVNPANGRVEAVSRMLYDQLVIEESRTTQLDPDKAAEVLAQAALAKGPDAFDEPGELERLLSRMRFAAEHAPDAGIVAPGEAEIRAAMVEMCQGRRSLGELKEASLVATLKSQLGGQQQAALERLAPDRIRLPGGRQVRVNYEPGKPPWIESRLQDFFGMANGPSLAGGRVPLVIHLLAPNQRAVQVTTDLAGFWDRHYPALRKELGRKYPRHSWPEDPRTAEPPQPGGRRR